MDAQIGDHGNRMITPLSKMARTLRRSAIEMIYDAGSGHPGGSLSAADIITALYFHHLRIFPEQPERPDRDRFILSKGHAAPILYAALAHRGFFPIEELHTLRRLDSRLQGHPDRLKTPGVEMTTGALGHGICIGVGLALAAKLDQAPYHTYVLLGDGELQAGVVWEGVMAAAKYRLANLTAIVDYNDVQLDGFVHDIMPVDPLIDKWNAFGWHTLELDGHNMRQIVEALDEARNIHDTPTVLIAHTTKGKGVSFMENRSVWHGRVLSADEYRQALAELERECHD